MEKTVLNDREPLMNFLDKEGKAYKHSDIDGGYETVYVLPISLKDKFWGLYSQCLWNSASEWIDCISTPPEQTVGRIVTGETEFNEGDYGFLRRGYDFDGFYQNGESGNHHCKEYITFHTASVYSYKSPIGGVRTVIDRDHYADGKDISKTTVCFV